MFGIKPPCDFGNPEVNTMAFNLFAMEIEEEEERLAAARLVEEEDLDESDG